jgi:hypothetical protein
MSTNSICKSKDCTLCIQSKESPKIEDLACQICDSHIPIAINCITPKCLFLLCSECFANLDDKKCPQCMESTFQEHRIEWLVASLNPCKFDSKCTGHIAKDEVSCKFDPALQEKCKLATSAKDLPCALDPSLQGFSPRLLRYMLERMSASTRFPTVQAPFATNLLINIVGACDCGNCVPSIAYVIARFMTRSLGFWRCTQCNKENNRYIICTECDAPPTSPMVSHQMFRIMHSLSFISSAIASYSQERQIRAIVNAINLIVSISKEYEHLSIQCEACTSINTDGSDKCLVCYTKFKNPLVLPMEVVDIKSFLPSLEYRLKSIPSVVRGQDGYYSITTQASVSSPAYPLGPGYEYLNVPAQNRMPSFSSAMSMEYLRMLSSFDISSSEADLGASSTAAGGAVEVSSSSNDSMWSCEFCTYSNSSDSQKCEICLTER